MHKMKTSFVSPEMPQAHGLTKLVLIVEFYIRIKRFIFFQYGLVPVLTQRTAKPYWKRHYKCLVVALFELLLSLFIFLFSLLNGKKSGLGTRTLTLIAFSVCVCVYFSVSTYF